MGSGAMLRKDWFRHSEVNDRQRGDLMNVLLFYFFEISEVDKTAKVGTNFANKRGGSSVGIVRLRTTSHGVFFR
jgi:hypothetical protein